MISLLAAALVLAPSLSDTPAEAVSAETPILATTVGECAWSQLPDSEQAAILQSFKTNPRYAVAGLNRYDQTFQQAASTCSGRTDLPSVWGAATITSHVIMLASSQSLSDSSDIERARLDAAWAEAPAAARDCALNTTARSMGISRPACTDAKQIEAFLQPFGLSRSKWTQRSRANAVINYMHAKAQSTLVEDLIATSRPLAH